MRADLADDKLLIVRDFAAPAALLFALWTDPAHLVRWMGPREFDCPHAETDLRVGGRYRVLIRSAAHGDNWFHGVYREIEPGRRLVFTFTWDNSGASAGVEMLVTITFAEQGGTTVQSFHQVWLPSRSSRDDHVHGWNDTFDKLADYAARITKELNA